MSAGWNPDLYQNSHSFVWELGRELVPLLAPRPGERILDLGCGTGQLTAEIARSGAEVVGVDRSAEMIAEARRNFPELRIELADATALPFSAEFDAVFSNAVLHWIGEADDAAAGMSRALKPGGRLVVELGGRGNLRRLLEAVSAALGPDWRHPWYYPSVGEYSALLERHGFEVRQAALFDRPTRLEHGRDGLRQWFAMFAPEVRGEFLAQVEERAAAELLQDGVWTVDYRRLRVVAVKAAAP